MGELLLFGLRLTVYGMGLVFLLLALLWGLVTLLVRTDAREQEPEPEPPGRSPHGTGAGFTPALEPVVAGADELPPEMLAAVAIAMRAHIRARRRQAAPAMRAHQPGSLPSRWVGAGRTRQNRTFTPRGRFS
ncbi:MAG: OadG family protein [Vicinamibacteria bacterium]|nr:OadG family protein [Vicinamibacteria bacterium]